MLPMLPSATGLENVQGHLRQLLGKKPLDEGVEREIKEELIKALRYLRDISEAITLLERATDAYEAKGVLWSRYDVWQAIPVRDPDELLVRQAILNLQTAEQLNTLLDQIVQERQTILIRQQAIEKRILAAWHQKFPRFSSMGIVSSDLQSERLKDTETLARR